ncbi:plasmid mobilization protein [Ruminococcus intestinalis]|uniref:plasmid mobilization protein n=1 Tax=Ruminococcus intestinalis TaxID=2763066 RepID=UPI003F7F2B4E
MKNIRIAVRVTAKEKEKIQSKARTCGLSTTEYVKQRALGYEPRSIPPDALFVCLEKLDELEIKTSSPELDEEIHDVLKQIVAECLLPGKG